MRRMENLVFSLNATVPIFLMMVLGMLFRKLGWMDEEFAVKMNKFVFLIPLPVLLFGDLAKVDFLLCSNIYLYYNCCTGILHLERPFNPGGIYTGFVPEQRSTSWNCIYPEYLWKCRDGATYDHWKCTTL